MLNVVAIMGRLVADPELRTTQSGTNVCSFRIACDRNFARQGEQRQAVLRAQGGVSFGAVFLCVLLLSVCGSAFTLLLGPDLQAILNAFYG